jgi:hypothetical protein
MAGNGSDPRLETLENTLRGVVPTPPVNEVPTPKEAVYDLMTRAGDTARAMRDLAQYSSHVADDIDRIIAAYVGHMHRLLGKVGK